MSTELVTKRLRLAPLRETDRDALLALLSDPEVGKTYMVPELCTREQQDAVFSHLYRISRAKDRFFCGVYREARLIGLIHEVEKEGSSMELGYVIATSEKGRGYASEALRAAIAYLFSIGWETIRAAAFAENAASMRVMEKCGMTRTGHTETITYREQEHTCIEYEISSAQGLTD